MQLEDDRAAGGIEKILADGFFGAIEHAARPKEGAALELPDSVTFAEHPSFAGDGGPGLYPVQRTLMKLIHLETELFTEFDRDYVGRMSEGYHRGQILQGFQPDVLRRVELLQQAGRNHFKTVVFIGGRRGGKGHLGALMMARQLYRLIALDDPQAHYGIAAGKHLRTLVTATTHPQARDAQFADLFQVVTRAPCFEPHLAAANRNHLSLWTPADRRRVAELGRRDRRQQLEHASIRASAISPNAPGARGSTCIGLVFDEFAHSLEGTDGVRTGEQIYRALIPSLGQVHPDGLVYVPTSPWTKETHAHKLYEMALKVGQNGEPAYPDILLIHLPSWGPYEAASDLAATEGRVFVSVPMAPDDRVEQERESDEASYSVEFLAQWREVEDAFLRPSAVESIFAPFCSHCGMPMAADEVCGLCGGEPHHLTEAPRGLLIHTYRGHADPGGRGANFAYAIAHQQDFTSAQGDVWSHVILDRLRVFRPEDYPNMAVPYDLVEDCIVEDVREFQTLEVFTQDQYAAEATLPKLQERLRINGHNARVWKLNFSQGSNRERADITRMAIARGWVHAFRDTFGPQDRSLLELELKSLKLKGDRVVPPTGGPIRTKDAADCLMVLIEEFLGDQLRRPNWERLSAIRPAFGAQGGYSTKMELPGPSSSGGTSLARQRLNAFTEARRLERMRSGIPAGWSYGITSKWGFRR